MFSTRITAESTMMPKSTAPNRQQVRAFATDHQQNRGEEEREGNIQPDDDGAAEITEEDPLD